MPTVVPFRSYRQAVGRRYDIHYPPSPTERDYTWALFGGVVGYPTCDERAIPPVPTFPHLR